MGNTWTFYLQCSTRSPLWFLIFHCILFFIYQFLNVTYGAMTCLSAAKMVPPKLLSEFVSPLSIFLWHENTPLKIRDHTQSLLRHQIQIRKYTVYLRSKYINLLNISSVSDKHFVYHRFRKVYLLHGYPFFFLLDAVKLWIHGTFISVSSI